MLIFVPLAIVGMILIMTIGGVIVRELWNWLLPTLFGLPPVTFWQALGVLMLSRILFGGWGSSGGHRSRRWDRMTPEERERFRQGMRARFGLSPSGGDATHGGAAPPS